nr:MAG TPA: hypothetical protein [Caudoviricetes sp.]
MATRSLLKNINVGEPTQVKAFLNALETSKEYVDQEVPLSRRLRDVKKNELSKFVSKIKKD